MSLDLFCITLIALVLSLVITAGENKHFLGLLPLWGFFFGYSIQASITSCVVGFIVGVIFAVLSYLFNIFGVAAMAGSIGYGLGVSFILWIGLTPGLITCLIGIVLGAILILLTLWLRLERHIVIIGTALIGRRPHWYNDDRC